jgi:hypothetical protein
MMLVAVAFALLLGCGVVASAAEPKVSLSTVSAEIPFNPKDYPRFSTSEAVEKLPCPGSGLELKDALLSFPAGFQGAVRKTPPKHYEMMRRWTKAVGDPDAIVKYKEEVTVVEGRRTHWLPVPEGLLPFLEMDLRPGDRFLAFLVYVGCVDGAALFAIDEYRGIEVREEELGDQIIRAPEPAQLLRRS